jgi:hypothetical protein
VKWVAQLLQEMKIVGAEPQPRRVVEHALPGGARVQVEVEGSEHLAERQKRREPARRAGELLQLLPELDPFVPSGLHPIPLHSDNQAAISISSHAGVAHSRTKHIDLRHHYVRECVARGELRVTWVASTSQLADVLTKGLDKTTFTRLSTSIMQAEQL